MSGSYAVQRVHEEHPNLKPEFIRQRLAYATFVNLERRYMYYEVPKAACTFIKLLIHSLEKLPPITPGYAGPLEVRRDMFIHNRAQFKLKALPDFDDREQENILTSPDFLRFTVVRDPYARLQSAWKDKILTCAPGYRHYYLRIKGRLPDERDPRSFMKFPEFVEAIAKEDSTTWDQHWRIQVEHVFHDSMNFNLIGRSESLADAINIFLARAGFSSRPMPAPANTSIADVPYDQAVADRVYSLYEPDFVAYGYARDAWKGRAAASRPETVSESKFLGEVTERNIVLDHLYRQRAELTKRLRSLEPSPVAANLNANRTTPFSKLFKDIISPIKGWLAEEEAGYLYRMAQSVADGCIVEIGSYRGRSTAALGFGTNAGGRLPVFAVEPHEPFRGVFGGDFGPLDRGHFMQTMLTTGLYHQVRLINLSSEFLSDLWPLPVTLLFIDADHRYEAVKRDFERWRGKLAPTATVVFDDAANPSSGPGRLARELAAGGDFSIDETVGKLLSMRRLPPSAPQS